MNRPLVLSLIVTASLLVLTPAAIASPRPDHTHRHHDSSDWAGSGDGRGDLHRRDAVWSFYDNRDDDSDSSDDSSDDSDSDSSDDATTGTGGAVVAPETGTQAVAGGAVKTGAQQTIQVQTTSYNNADNQGGNNATICCGVLHKTASGDGSFGNPITLAVPGSGSSMQTPAGTRVYFVKYRFYGVVEDSGASPQSLRRFDIWSDGRGLSTSAGSACMDALTGTSAAILNPPAGKPVGHLGPLADASGCHVAAGGS